MPITALTFTVAAISMAGIPQLSGFWSKEEILTAAAGFSPERFPAAGQLFLIVGLATSFLTAFYISRAVILTFFGQPKEKSHAHESPFVMTGPLIILMVGAAGVGLLGAPFTGEWFQHFLGIEAHGGHHGPEWIPLASVYVATAGILLALLRYALGWMPLSAGVRQGLSPVYRLVSNKYYIDEIYDAFIIQPLFRVAGGAYSFDGKVIDGAVNGAGALGMRVSAMKKWFDQTIVDGLVNGIAQTFGRAGQLLRRGQTGLVQNYILIAFGGAMAILVILQWFS